MEATVGELRGFFGTVWPHLNEVQRRVVAGALAQMLERGGKSRVAEASGMSRNTVIKALAEVEAGIEPSARLRPGGWGRPAGGGQAAWDLGGARRAGASRAQ